MALEGLDVQQGGFAMGKEWSKMKGWSKNAYKYVPPLPYDACHHMCTVGNGSRVGRGAVMLVNDGGWRCAGSRAT